MRRLHPLVVLLIASWAAGAVGQERTSRHAILVANNAGSKTDGATLRFAHRDVEELRQVLVDLGGFSPDDVTVLLERAPDDLARAFEDVAEAVAKANSKSDSTMFLFFYSGHADRDGLHLGEEVVSGKQLKELVAGVPARVRVGIVDACNAGALVLTKGGTPAASFLSGVDELKGVKGTAFVMSSGASEKAQEALEFRHSVFTYWLLAGLRGAADYSADGWVTLAEVWDYVKSGTRLTSSRTGIPQRPTWEINLRGQDSVRLTDLNRADGSNAVLEFRGEGEYFIFKSGRNLVAEVSAQLPGHRLVLGPGEYLVRRLQAGEPLREATVTLTKGSTLALEPSRMEKIPYLNLAAKGRARSNWFRQGFSSLVHFHGQTLQGLGSLVGAGLGWPMIFGSVWVAPRVLLGGSSFQSVDTSVDMLEVELDSAVGYGFDFGRLVLRPQISVGGVLGHQDVSEPGGDYTRTSLGGRLGGGLGLVYMPFDRRTYVDVVAEGAAYFHRRQRAGGSVEWIVAPTFGVLVGLGFVL